MPPHPKKPKLISPSAIVNDANAVTTADRIAAPVDGGNNPTIDGFSNNLTARILGFLGYKDIMRSRICCKKFRDAARNTIVPWVDTSRTFSWSILRESEVSVTSVTKYNAMAAMTQALPNLQQLSIQDFERGHKYSDGEESTEVEADSTANWTTHDIQIISSFRKLRSLEIIRAPLNGRYSSLFKFPLLQTLRIFACYNLKCDLEMLSGLPSLKELYYNNSCVTGNIKSLRVIKDTIEKVDFGCCDKIEGDLMDLADFPRLKVLMLPTSSQTLTGDIRKIGENDFPKLEQLRLGKGVIGAQHYEFQRISDVPSVVEATYRLNQREPRFIQNLNLFYWKLSRDSPDWYDANGQEGYPPPPFFIDFVQVGTRVGWRWNVTRASYSDSSNSCEINWLDPEPDSESNDYDVYIRELQSIQEDIFCFEGYQSPPSEEEYKRLCEEYYGI